jgi:hypothetical protein
MPTIHENDSAEKIRGSKRSCKALQISRFVEASGGVGCSRHRAPINHSSQSLMQRLSSLLREKGLFWRPPRFSPLLIQMPRLSPQLVCVVAAAATQRGAQGQAEVRHILLQVNRVHLLRQHDWNRNCKRCIGIGRSERRDVAKLDIDSVHVLYGEIV